MAPRGLRVSWAVAAAIPPPPAQPPPPRHPLLLPPPGREPLQLGQVLEVVDVAAARPLPRAQPGDGDPQNPFLPFLALQPDLLSRLPEISGGGREQPAQRREAV